MTPHIATLLGVCAHLATLQAAILSGGLRVPLRPPLAFLTPSQASTAHPFVTTYNFKFAGLSRSTGQTHTETPPSSHMEPEETASMR
jgi:hypothetical protein